MGYLKKFSAASVMIFAIAAIAVAQQKAPPLTVQEIKGGVYWAKGGAGGNTGIIIGKDGVIVVDAKSNPASAKDMIDEIAKLTPFR